jgi:DNA-binding transcriptional MerR regulator
MKVKEIARLAEVSPDTVRFYNRQGLLRPRQNPRNGYYVYVSDDLCRLRFIRMANKLGLSLDEIKVILSQAMEDGLLSGDLKALFTDRLSRLEQELNELKRLRDDMNAAIEVWQQMPDGAPNGYSVQELIEQWS